MLYTKLCTHNRATTKAAWGHISRTARGSESHDDAQPDAHHAAHPQPLVTRGAALPFIDALPGNEGVLVVQLPKQLPWQRAVVHAVDAQPGDQGMRFLCTVYDA